jgi:transcriptional regulator with PAS, ATPase and Fis domain
MRRHGISGPPPGHIVCSLSDGLPNLWEVTRLSIASSSRGRLEDLELLVDAFITELNEKYGRQVKSVDDATLAPLRAHGGPGNVRELRNIIERAVVGSEGDMITSESLPFASPPTTKPTAADAVILPLGTTLEQGERELIQRTLESVKNNKTRAAAILGTTPKTLQNKARRWRCEAGETAGS